MTDLIPQPDGQTRISDSVVNAIVLSAARETAGVLDIAPLARGAVVGGTVGSILGLVAGGAGGAVVGAVVGASTGSFAGAAMSEMGARHHFLDMKQPVGSVEVQISALYGADLLAVGDEVRAKVRNAFDEILGLVVDRIDVVFVAVVDVPGGGDERGSST